MVFEFQMLSIKMIPVSLMDLRQRVINMSGLLYDHFAQDFYKIMECFGVPKYKCLV